MWKWINWIISKRAKPIFFKIKSNQSIYHNKANDVKFGFGVDLLNMMASAVRSVLSLDKSSQFPLHCHMTEGNYMLYKF